MTDLIKTAILTCPKARGGVIDFDMQKLYIAENRAREVASVTKVKAPELMYTFERAYALASDYMLKACNELNFVKIDLQKRKALVSIDIAPEILKKKGLVNAKAPGGTVDLRNDVVNSDPEYVKLLELEAEISAKYEFLKVKTKSFEMLYQSVKKVYDSLNNFGGLDGSGGIKEETSPVDVSDGLPIGKARY